MNRKRGQGDKEKHTKKRSVATKHTESQFQVYNMKFNALAHSMKIHFPLIKAHKHKRNKQLLTIVRRHFIVIAVIWQLFGPTAIKNYHQLIIRVGISVVVRRHWLNCVTFAYIIIMRQRQRAAHFVKLYARNDIYFWCLKSSRPSSLPLKMRMKMKWANIAARQKRSHPNIVN